MRYLSTALAVSFMLILPVLAQTVDTGTHPAPVVDTVVRIPIGSWLADLQGYAVLAMAGVVGWVFKWFPARLRGIMLTMQADQLVAKGLTFAVNLVVGGLKDKVWTIDVRNQILKELTTYVLVHGASVVKDFIGTPAEIAEKGFARMAPPLDARTGLAQDSQLPAGPKPDFDHIGAQAQAAATIKGMQAT